MKTKANWVTFVPLTVGAILLHVYHLVFIGGEEITQPLFGEYSLLINKQTEPELIVIFAAVLFAFSLLFYAVDRKTAAFCEIKGAPISGFFLILSGLVLGVDSAVSLTTGVGSSPVNSSSLLNIVALATALLFAVVGMGLLVGFNISKKIRLFMLLPTVWSAVCMVTVFVSHRKEAPSFGMFDVFSWVFLTLFLFENSMVLCGIEIKNPVKASFLYGLTFVLFSFVYAISCVFGQTGDNGSFDVTKNMPGIYMGLLGFYALFSLFKLSGSMITKEAAAQYVTESEQGDDDFDEDKSEEEEDSVPEAAFGVGSNKFVTAEFDKIRLEKAAKKAKERNTGTIPAVAPTEEKLKDFEDDEEDDESMSTLDKIDQLIMELSDDGDDE